MKVGFTLGFERQNIIVVILFAEINIISDSRRLLIGCIVRPISSTDNVSEWKRQVIGVRLRRQVNILLTESSAFCWQVFNDCERSQWPHQRKTFVSNIKQIYHRLSSKCHS